jgi:hypothetical protein
MKAKPGNPKDSHEQTAIQTTRLAASHRGYLVSVNGDSSPKFLLGHVVATQNALAGIPSDEMLLALSRHERGDWGTLNPEDRDANEKSLKDGGRLVSRYNSTANVKFWIITEWNRKLTTVLLPKDY